MQVHSLITSLSASAPTSAAPGPSRRWLPSPQLCQYNCLQGQMVRKPGELNWATVSLPLTPRVYSEFPICHTHNTDTCGRAEQQSKGVKPIRTSSTPPLHKKNKLKKNQGIKALIKPQLHTLIVMMNLTSSGLNQFSNHSGCLKGCSSL